MIVAASVATGRLRSRGVRNSDASTTEAYYRRQTGKHGVGKACGDQHDSDDDCSEKIAAERRAILASSSLKDRQIARKSNQGGH
jgi:hypothetical protein